MGEHAIMYVWTSLSITASYNHDYRTTLNMKLKNNSYFSVAGGFLSLPYNSNMYSTLV